MHHQRFGSLVLSKMEPGYVPDILYPCWGVGMLPWLFQSQNGRVRCCWWKWSLGVLVFWFLVATLDGCNSENYSTNPDLSHITESRILYGIQHMMSELALNQWLKSYCQFKMTSPNRFILDQPNFWQWLVQMMVDNCEESNMEDTGLVTMFWQYWICQLHLHQLKIMLKVNYHR